MALLCCCLTASPLEADQEPERSLVARPHAHRKTMQHVGHAPHASRPYANPDVDASEAKTNNAVAGTRHHAVPFQVTDEMIPPVAAVGRAAAKISNPEGYLVISRIEVGVGSAHSGPVS